MQMRSGIATLQRLPRQQQVFRSGSLRCPTLSVATHAAGGNKSGNSSQTAPQGLGAKLSRENGREPDGALTPAPFAFTMSYKLMCTKFKEIDSIRGDEGKGKKILVITTGESRLPMANGTTFATGHNVTELFIPLYHLQKAGYEIQICTPSGKPVAIEEWSMPSASLGGYDREVVSMRQSLRSQLDRPTDVKSIRKDLQGYAGVFMPGGHGPMANLHEVKEVGELLMSAHEQGLPTAALCHGPNSLRATMKVADKFPYAGYKMCVFPDIAESIMWVMRYLPGPMIQKPESELKALGANIQSVHIDKMVVQDRELVTATSHRGAQEMSEKFLEVLSNARVKQMARA